MDDGHPADDDSITASPADADATFADMGSSSIVELSPRSSAKKRATWPFVIGIVAVLAAAVGAIAVAAGGDGHKVSTLAQAAAKTEGQHSARVEFTTSVPLAGFSGKEILVTGEYDFDRRILHYDFDITELMKTTTPDAPPGAGKITAKAQGLTVFMKMGIFDQEPKLKGKWMKLDIGKQVSNFGVDLDKVAEFEAAGPASALAKLQTLLGSVETLGTEDVRGVKTTHYRATYDFAQVYRARGAVTDEAAFAKLLDLYSSTTATSEAWVDNDGLVRRTVNSIPLKAGVQTVKAEFFDFGIAVNVAVPSEADTFSVDDLQALARGK